MRGGRSGRGASELTGLGARGTDPLVWFWTLEPVDPFNSWTPDDSPERFLSGFGHSFVELYVRFRDLGLPVGIGGSVPRGATAVVVSLEDLTAWQRYGRPRHRLLLSLQILRTGAPLAIIRNDVYGYIKAPLSTVLEIMPSAQAVKDPPGQRYLPLLPQRGLVPREVDRASEIRTIAIKAYAANLPEWVEEASSRLSAMGVELRIDTDRDVPNRWPDFKDVDAVLCSQPTDLRDALRKPATKLINTWCAGAIPLIEPWPSYQDLAQEEDSVAFDSVDELVAAVARINLEPSVAADLLARSRERGREWEAAEVAGGWFQELGALDSSSRSRATADLLIACALTVASVPHLRGVRAAVSRSRERARSTRHDRAGR